ncbi:MAG: hypothetical protein M1837_004924 [Sclerophora amabilis]|nr:MAG: hypothetical protein M1837_004924 [Sclerophora amabilis]
MNDLDGFLIAYVLATYLTMQSTKESAAAAAARSIKGRKAMKKEVVVVVTEEQDDEGNEGGSDQKGCHGSFFPFQQQSQIDKPKKELPPAAGSGQIDDDALPQRKVVRPPQHSVKSGSSSQQQQSSSRLVDWSPDVRSSHGSKVSSVWKSPTSMDSSVLRSSGPSSPRVRLKGPGPGYQVIDLRGGSSSPSSSGNKKQTGTGEAAGSNEGGGPFRNPKHAVPPALAKAFSPGELVFPGSPITIPEKRGSRAAPWSLKEAQMVVDRSLRGETHEGIAQGLTGRSAAAVDQLMSVMIHFRQLPRQWKTTLRQQQDRGEGFTEKLYTLHEDAELVCWYWNQCKGITCSRFHESHSRESLRKRLSDLEMAQDYLMPFERDLIVQTFIEWKRPNAVPDYNRISRKVRLRTGNCSLVASVCLAAVAWTFGPPERKNPPVYIPWHRDRKATLSYWDEGTRMDDVKDCDRTLVESVPDDEEEDQPCGGGDPVG